MKRLIRSFTTLAVVFVALATANVPGAAATEPTSKFKAGDAAPDFTLQDIGGRSVQLSAAGKNKAVLLAFWSLRCGACLQEVPYLEALHQKMSGSGVVVLSVVTDGVDAAATKQIMKEVQAAPSYPVLVDPDFAVSDTYTNFLVPHTLVIDRKGVVQYVHTGFEPGAEKEYEAALLKALGQKK